MKPWAYRRIFSILLRGPIHFGTRILIGGDQYNTL